MCIRSLLTGGFGCLILIWLAGCAALRPDVYQGDGVWMRGDGTIFEAAPPLQVMDAEIKNVSIRERVRTVEKKNVNEKGETVIREREVIEIDTGIDIEVTLENEETYVVFLKGSGENGATVTGRSGFTASNDYVYSVTGQIYLDRDVQRVLINIESRGPVRYQNTLAYRLR